MKDELSYMANHTYREGYDDGYQQGKEDAIHDGSIRNILQDIVYAQSMINRSVSSLNRILGSEPKKR